MQILGIILVIYGAFCIAALLLRFPFVYNNGKAKLFIKMIGKTGFDILILVFGLAALIGGILILS